ncbi:hypothetical protein GPLA_1313 [Paraglaciecola polaris LMG 21857]|uniref:Uncharacterized protein n=1 Tax=Paraglaciecola polaris LMG 21857 TaxID=1129793 RepID=K6ZPK5_9ALTE|nr:hypothetical protein GPLA_1313 [Paraglaciecola polaris LMG 21857]
MTKIKQTAPMSRLPIINENVSLGDIKQTAPALASYQTANRDIQKATDLAAAPY